MNDFVLNELALRIAQLEVEKAFLKSENIQLKEQLKEREEKENEKIDN